MTALTKQWEQTADASSHRLAPSTFPLAGDAAGSTKLVIASTPPGRHSSQASQALSSSEGKAMLPGAPCTGWLKDQQGAMKWAEKPLWYPCLRTGSLFFFWPGHVGFQFPNQGSNLWPLHGSMKSKPLDCQGSPQCLSLQNWQTMVI